MPRHYYVKATRKERTIETLHRFERGLLAYDLSSKSELQIFVRDRGLQDTIPATALKHKIIKRLEAADDTATFDRFLDLPPELPVMVYEFHFESFGPIDIAEQPPITMVSKDIRRESLPLFYQVSCFTFTITPGNDSSSGPILDNGSRLILNRLTDNQLARIENLHLRIKYDRNFYVEWHVNLFNPDGVCRTRFKGVGFKVSTYFQKMAEDIVDRNGSRKLRREDFEALVKMIDV